MRFLFTLTFSFSIFLVFSQDYKKADSIAIVVSNSHMRYNTIEKLTHALTDELKNPKEKYRAIFKWINLNIEYSSAYSSYNEKNILKTKKAVCHGYSMLLKDMCDKCDIKCEYVGGICKRTPDEIGLKKEHGAHAWNAVLFDSIWYLSDATWASSVYNMSTKITEYGFEESYFLNTPQNFIFNHFPDDKKWQLLKHSISRRKFLNYPHLSTLDNMEFKRKLMKSFRGNRGYLFFNKLKFEIDTLDYTKLYCSFTRVKNDLYNSKRIAKLNKKHIVINLKGIISKSVTIYYNDRAILGYKRRNVLWNKVFYENW